jgi:hypothetical protein
MVIVLFMCMAGTAGRCLKESMIRRAGMRKGKKKKKKKNNAEGTARKAPEKTHNPKDLYRY